MVKPVIFRGDSLERLQKFPRSARQDAGYQIELVQRGHSPDDFKPMSSIGSGVQEIRIRDPAGAFRIMYVARFEDAVYVLHAFQKKTAKTSMLDLELARQRYRRLSEEKR